MKLFLFSLLIGLMTQSALAGIDAFMVEQSYDFYRQTIEAGSPLDAPATPYEQKLAVDALWDFVAENSDKSIEAQKQWENLNFTAMQLPEQLRLYLLGTKINGKESRLSMMKSVVKSKLSGKLDKRSLIIIFNHSNTLRERGLDIEVDQAVARNPNTKLEYDTVTRSDAETLSRDEVIELLNIKRVQPTIFVFCRENREYGCSILIKDKNGQFYRNNNFELFSLPMLAHTRLKLPFHHENGATPAGVYYIDSVMPAPDKQLEFGKNRRLILNMAESADAKKILPASQLAKSWWKQTVLAKDLGRGNLRVHGTGVLNTDKDSLHPNLVPSVGCLKLREGEYDGITYNDQRSLLNTLMKLQGLLAKFENEPLIHATLVLFHIPGEGTVTGDEVRSYLDQ